MSRSLRARVLAYSLISAFNNEIGRKFAGLSGGLPGLGRVTIVACRFSDGMAPPFITKLNAEHRCGVNVEEWSFKYSLENPSGPGDLPLGKEWMAESISCSVKGAFKDSRWAFETVGRLTESRKESIAASEGIPMAVSSFKLYNLQ